MPAKTVHFLIASLLIGVGSCTSNSSSCPACPIADTSPIICAVQLWSPNALRTFTECQLNAHNCVMPQKTYIHVSTGACPADGNAAINCRLAIECDTTFWPVCGQSLITKRKQRFDNVCQLQLASCQSPHDPFLNLGSLPCQNELNI